MKETLRPPVYSVAFCRWLGGVGVMIVVLFATASHVDSTEVNAVFVYAVITFIMDCWMCKRLETLFIKTKGEIVDSKH